MNLLCEYTEVQYGGVLQQRDCRQLLLEFSEKLGFINIEKISEVFHSTHL